MRDRRTFSARVLIAALISIVIGARTTCAIASNPRPFQFALPNGLVVLVIPDHRAPVVTQMLWFRVGAADDPPGLSGVAHFFEHMMFRGTKSLPGEGYAQAIARNGGDSNAYTTHDYTCFYEQLAKDRLKTVMALEADRMANLDLSESNVTTEREVVLEERRMTVDNNPQELLEEQMEAALYLSHPYGRPVIGWSSEVRRIGRVEAQEFYDRHYAPNDAVLVVAGDVTPAEVRDDAQATYGKVPARAHKPRSEFGQPPRFGETRLMVQSAESKVPYFSRIYRVPSYAEAAPGQAESLDVLAQILGGDESAALYRTLVVDKRLATDAGASYEGMTRDAAEFTIFAAPRNGIPLDAVERAADQVLAAATKRPPSAKDLERAKTQLIARTIYRRDSQYALAEAYGEALAIGMTTEDVQAWPARVRAVSANALMKEAQMALDKREAVSAYLMPKGAK